jgi:probable rRNA maturation factor
MSTVIENRQRKIKVDLRRVRSTVVKILNGLNCRNKDLGLLFVDDEEIRALNRQYLDRDRPTNVLSFSMQEGAFAGFNPLLLGDIVISVERAQQDALEAKIDFDDEVDFLIIHGFLHLLGYNHENASEIECLRMKAKERDIFFMLKGYFLENE